MNFADLLLWQFVYLPLFVALGYPLAIRYVVNGLEILTIAANEKG
jgi:hypothetical protein